MIPRKFKVQEPVYWNSWRSHWVTYVYTRGMIITIYNTSGQLPLEQGVFEMRVTVLFAKSQDGMFLMRYKLMALDWYRKVS